MELAITTPALLFPAISLLMISYTTRFLHLANLARSLHALKAVPPEPTVLEQNIGKRILLIRNTQATGITSLLLCVICMFLLFGKQGHIAGAVFGTGFLVSLGFSDVAAVAVCLLTVLALAWLCLPGIRQAYVEIMDILKTRIDEAGSAG
jgi:hypothetical protein